MASLFGIDEKKLLRKRRAAEKRFRLCAIFALFLAGAFLVFFLFDISMKGYPAFQQAELLVTVNYTAEAHDNPYAALDADTVQIVSRSFTRLIPSMMAENSRLIGTTQEQWVLASADTDQYMKGRPNRLRPKHQALVDTMRQEGKARLAFNTGFFEAGDSKLPELAGIRAAAVGSIYVLLITLAISFPVGVIWRNSRRTTG